MSLQNPPFALQAATVLHGAKLFRDAVSSLVGPTGGVVTAGDFATSEHIAANSSVNVAVGQAWVPGTLATDAGLYYIRNTATVNLPISASDSTNPRVEKIVLRIKDSSYAGTEDEAALEVIKGTATGGATLANKTGVGATPASSLVLAYVLVPAKATSIVAANIENVATPFLARRAGGEEYGAQVERTADVEYEPSTTRNTFVVASVKCTSGSENYLEARARVNGVVVGQAQVAGNTAAEPEVCLRSSSRPARSGRYSRPTKSARRSRSNRRISRSRRSVCWYGSLMKRWGPWPCCLLCWGFTSRATSTDRSTPLGSTSTNALATASGRRSAARN